MIGTPAGRVGCVGVPHDRGQRPMLTTEEDDNGLGLGRDEAEEEHVLAATPVALKNRLSQGALGVQAHLGGGGRGEGG